jgi:hypothetical protein
MPGLYYFVDPKRTHLISIAKDQLLSKALGCKECTKALKIKEQQMMDLTMLETIAPPFPNCHVEPPDLINLIPTPPAALMAGANSAHTLQCQNLMRRLEV